MNVCCKLLGGYNIFKVGYCVLIVIYEGLGWSEGWFCCWIFVGYGCWFVCVVCL